MEKATVGDLKELLKSMPDATEVWLSSDEEGNYFGPLLKEVTKNHRGQDVHTLSCEIVASKLLLFPASGFEDEFEAGMIQEDEEGAVATEAAQPV